MRKIFLCVLPVIVILALALSACGPFEITYHFDLNYEGAPAMDSITFTNDITPELPEDPVRAGYFFNGWTFNNGNSSLEEDDVFYMDVTFKAEWLEIFTVSFDANSLGATNPASQEVPETHLATEPTDELLNGNLALFGWCTDEELTNVFDFTTPISADTTLYAKWVEVYDITYDQNYEGSPADSIVSFMDGETYTLPTSPVRAGYTFLGWYTMEDYTAIGAIQITDNYVVIADVTVYAAWEGMIVYS